MRRILFLAGACAALACRCERGSAQNGQKECSVDSDCPFGRACVDERCVSPDAGEPADAGWCFSDADCDVDAGYACVRSTGQCIKLESPDAGVEEPDAGIVIPLCRDDEKRSCGVSKIGACRYGEQTCSDGGFGPCVGAINPQPESCDALDNDCDGPVDEDYAGAKSVCGVGECRREVDVCVSGVPQACVPGPKQTETCNFKDDDCDGSIDNAIPDVTTGTGVCACTATCQNGVQSCTQGTPQTELCNGLDDDCDGTADNGVADVTLGKGVCACVAQCTGGVQTCAQGTPTTETCNGLDDDCNGTADDGVPDVTCGLGICQRTAACVAGSQTCTPGTGTAEICGNGLDDNCDGKTDENPPCTCVPNATQGCYTGQAGTQGVGACKAGTQTCDAGGQWGACVGEVTPVAETCDNVDNNCNGTTDETLTRSCYTGLPPGTQGVGACKSGTETCAAGVWGACVGEVTPVAETCDNVDNNCNGTTDEGLTRSCYTGLPPSTQGVGVCKAGTETCTGGTWGSCVGEVTPAPIDTCGDLKDNNCNGTTDEGCCADTTDNDLDTYQACIDCDDNDATIHPGATEKCNGRDDDCDGAIDEGYDQDGDTFTTCGTKPGGGLDTARVDCNDGNSFVYPLKSWDCGPCATAANPSCGPANTVDDNCNGSVDETCACSANDGDGDGFSQCTGDCNDGDKTIYPTAPELCDGKDNDCNKNTIENCNVGDPCNFAAGTDDCKPQFICVQDVKTKKYLCTSWCNWSELGTGVGDGCTSTQSCAANIINSDNIHGCLALNPGTKKPGDACTAGTECHSSLCAGDVSALGTYCIDLCGSDAYCQGLACSVQEGSAQGNTVWAGQCRKTGGAFAGTKTLGQACSRCTGNPLLCRPECRSGDLGCLNGKCTSVCCKPSDCPSGYYCSVTALSLTKNGSDTGAPVCVTKTHTGTRTTGQACAASGDCQTKFCEKANLGGVCLDVCCNDSNCPTGWKCDLMRVVKPSGANQWIRVCVRPPAPSTLTMAP